MHILIIERSKEITKRLEQLILDTTPDTSFDHADSFKEAMNSAQHPAADIVLMDIRFAEAYSFELLHTIRKVNPTAVIIILFHIADSHTVHLCKTQGANYVFDIYAEFEKIPPLAHHLHSLRTKNNPAKRQGFYKLCNEKKLTDIGFTG